MKVIIIYLEVRSAVRILALDYYPVLVRIHRPTCNGETPIPWLLQVSCRSRLSSKRG